MKKFIALVLVFVLMFSITSCDMLPDDVRVMIEDLTGGHIHDFQLSESESYHATCLKTGIEVRVCYCGEREETTLDALGHDMQVTTEVTPNCTRPGAIYYKCSRCDKKSFENLYPTGHNWSDSSSEPSRLIPCQNEGCSSGLLGESNHTHDEALTFDFSAEDEAALEAKYNEVLALIEAAAKYDPALHGYAETGALADEYDMVDAIHTELYDMVMNAVSQRTLAMVAYYCDMRNTELENAYSYMMDYCTAAIAKFYTLSRPFYDSCYREFYYYGMTDEEINAFLFDSDTLSNPEYTALKERNDAIEVEFLAITSPTGSSDVPVLYAEFVENNNKMAQMMGYDNYLEYAYENVYGRGYTYQDVAEFTEYAKMYISPLFTKYYTVYQNMSRTNEHYLAQHSYSFFSSLEGNGTLNDYIDLLAFDAEKQYSFSDEFNKLMSDGNMFRGNYEGAFVTSVASVNLPIAYFSNGYDTPFTIAHEFGHYMNEVYSGGEYSQSYDLLEMHSQGNELLYLAYLKSVLPADAYKLVETETMVNMLYIVLAASTVDAFEQAVYLNSYNGLGSEEIMADGKITYDEYDDLYNNICQEYGMSRFLSGYWRHMTITSPCYYISYSVSALSVLQLYDMAETKGFDVAKDAYLKLFTYIDEDPDMELDDILAYAGMLSFTDEQLYINLRNTLGK